MIHKLQPLPLSRTRATHRRQLVAPWGVLPMNLEEARFFRSWLVYESDSGLSQMHGYVN